MDDERFYEMLRRLVNRELDRCHQYEAFNNRPADLKELIQRIDLELRAREVAVKK